MADLVSEDTQGKSYGDISGLQSWILQQLKHLKIQQPTPIQYHCIPPALEGLDVIGAAKTGSGKTLAFVIPILQKLSVDPYGVYSLVLTPTRELAYQIADQFKGLGGPMNLRVSVIVGGMDIVKQGSELSRSPHIIVSTPVRLAEILGSSPQFTLKRIKALVLDEADRLMDGRFDGQLKTIFEALPEKRQTLLFSATITDRLQQMQAMAKTDVFLWQSSGEQATVQQLDEKYILSNPTVKDATMVAMLLKFQEEKPKALVIVFTDTCKSTQILSMMLNELGVESLSLHSMMPQYERLASLAKFKSSQVKVLLATDVASRGLDIPLVGLVVNHVVPNMPKNYIHRVGRTARAGRSGQAVTLINPHEIRILLAIEAETKRKMTEYTIEDSVVKRIMKQVNVTKREQEIKLDETNFDEKRNINRRKKLIMEGKDPEEEEKKYKKRLKNKRKKQEEEQQNLLQRRKEMKRNNLVKSSKTKSKRHKIQTIKQINKVKTVTVSI